MYILLFTTRHASAMNSSRRQKGGGGRMRYNSKMKKTREKKEFNIPNQLR
jgi:hypothetical protein